MKAMTFLDNYGMGAVPAAKTPSSVPRRKRLRLRTCLSAATASSHGNGLCFLKPVYQRNNALHGIEGVRRSTGVGNLNVALLFQEALERHHRERIHNPARNQRGGLGDFAVVA